MHGYGTVAISIDVDWAHDEVIEYLCAIFDQYRIRATFFCTHKITLQCVRKHELAIHPNFTRDKTEYQTLKELIELYPEAKGIRNHTLYLHGGLFDLYRQFGVEYDSNYFLPDQNIAPFLIVENVVELPMFFTDDALHLINHDSYNVAERITKEKGLKIFTFHPIHVFLNTKDGSEYRKAKPYLRNPEELKKFRNRDKGTKDLLIDLLEYVKKNNIECCTLKEVSDAFKKRMG